MRFRIGVLFLILSAGLAPRAWAQAKPPEEFNIREHYTKYEYRIPMRDGVHLFTSVYVPKDTSVAYPLLVDRTPYSVAPYGEDQYRPTLGPSDAFERAGYIFVYQDVRGRYMSEGKFVEMRPHIDEKRSNKDVDDSSDMYDTVDWLLRNVPNNNGKVGIWGISYPGFFTSASIIDSHPALKAASPQAPMTDLFMGDDAYHGGAFMLAANFGFYSAFKPLDNPTPPKATLGFEYGTESAYEFFLKLGPLANANARYFHDQSFLWSDQVGHTTYDDYWKARNLAPHMKNIRCAVLTVGGWFDAEDLSGPFKVFRSLEQNDPGIYNGLVEGPWVHGGWARWDGDHLGSVSFAAKTSLYFRDNIQFPFFEKYLKGKGTEDLPKAYVFETGTNMWRKYSSWPPANARTRVLYFQDQVGLSFTAPEAKQEAFDEYVSDPNRPVPFINYTGLHVPQEYMVGDQRFASTRTDVLVYQTEPLEQDVTIAGPVSPRLFVSTTGTDSDFVVKLIDVYPPDYPQPETKGATATLAPATPPLLTDVPPPSIVLAGYQQLLRGWPMRAKFRNSFEKPEPMTPGQVAQLDFTAPDINHTFRRNHRIMIQVQSTWFPLIDRNPQTFVNIPDAKPSDFQKATERVYRGKGKSSGVIVHVLE
jgi:putative CocE/NonD family hydrolase